MKKCKVCGKNSVGEFCFSHKPKKALRKSKGLKMSPGWFQQIRDTGVHPPDPYDRAEMLLMFFEIWKNNSHKSEVSGTYLGAEISTVFFHHILPKGKYPQAALDKENIILLTFDEHTNVENDMYKYEEINKRREALKRKYDL